MATSYLAGEPAGAQAMLHGKRLGHVGHRLVELLQVTLVFHLHMNEPDTDLNRCVDCTFIESLESESLNL